MISPLVVLLIVPLLAIVLMSARISPRGIALLAMAFNLVMTVVIMKSFPVLLGGAVRRLHLPWASLPGWPGINLDLSLNGISLIFLFLAQLLGFFAIAISPADVKRPREFYRAMLICCWSATGFFLSHDLVFILIFLSLAWAPGFLLIGFWGGQNRQQAAYQWALTGSSATLLISMVWWGMVWMLPLEHRSFDLEKIQAWLVVQPFYAVQQSFCFAFLVLGFVLLFPLVPGHTWLPTFYSASPLAFRVLQVGVIRLIAVYGLMRLTIPFLSYGFEMWRPWLMVLAAASLIYGALVGLTQKELSQALAYLVITQNGMILLAITSWNELALNGSILLLVGQALSSALLLGLAGEMELRTGENRLEKMGGMASVAPRWTGFFLCGMVSSLGIPGFATFAGLWLIYSGISITFLPTLVLIPLVGGMIQAGSLLRITQCLIWSKQPEQGKGRESSARDLNTVAEWGPYALILVFSLIFGFVPSLITRFTEQAITLLPYVK